MTAVDVDALDKLREAATFWAGPTELPATFPVDLFWSRVSRADTCWVWTGKSVTGYGRFMHRRKSYFAHRLAWFLTHGTIDPTLAIDHLCRNRACVNPDHMEQVTQGENVLRGVGRSAVNARKTTCNEGHPLDGPNLYLDQGYGRRCRICRNTWARTRKQTRAAALRASNGEGTTP